MGNALKSPEPLKETSRMSLISRWTQAVSRTGRDGMVLSRVVFGAVFPGIGAQTSSLDSLNTNASDRIKSVLLKEARNEPFPNSVAVSILKIEREFGLVKYWGLAEYLRQHRPLFSFSSRLSLADDKFTASSTNAETAANATNENSDEADGQSSSSAGAKVAFMITSSMKRDLIDGLGYPASTVKGMTPQQASLVLHNRLSPDSYEETIPGLEQEFAKEQERKVQQARFEAAEDQEERERDSRQSSSAQESRNSESYCHSSSSSDPNGESSSDAPLLLSSSSSQKIQNSEASLSPTQSPATTTADADSFSTPPSLKEEHEDDLWYEVVEIKVQADTSETTEIRHGLYKDHEEALLGLDTRQSIQKRRKADSLKSEDGGVTEEIRFVLRPISTKELQ